MTPTYPTLLAKANRPATTLTLCINILRRDSRTDVLRGRCTTRNHAVRAPLSRELPRDERGFGRTD